MQEIADSQIVLKLILSTLTKPENRLNRLDSSAMGKYLKGIKDVLYIPIFNSIYEHTWLFGYSAFGFLLSLFFASLIKEFAKKYVRINQR